MNGCRSPGSWRHASIVALVVTAVTACSSSVTGHGNAQHASTSPGTSFPATSSSPVTTVSPTSSTTPSSTGPTQTDLLSRFAGKWFRHGQALTMTGQTGAISYRVVERAHVERFVMRGRAMDGWLRIDPDGLETDDALKQWVSRGVSFARALPTK